MRKIVCYTLAMILFLPAAVFALERFDIVTTEELRQMLADRAAGKTEFLLVNSLDEIIYRDSSIPGSINIPWCRVAQMADRLGEDKDKLIITY
ncbi:MAG: hypothetical protein JSW39_08295 [Desulfobacterales bacterium]|nr:MAG: hypothetical protein JSW39_08295 [Desulfobacterales bacterium]